MKIVKIFTDGSCIGNSGVGGYGAVLIYHGNRKEVKKAFRLTTNNRMELLSVIEALKLLTEQCCVYGFKVCSKCDKPRLAQVMGSAWLGKG